MLVKRILGYGIVAALAIVLVAQWVGAIETARVAGSSVCYGLQPEPVDTPAADLALPDLAGNKRSLRDLRGKVVLLHFWFTRCPPCVEELPSLLKLHKAMKGTDFELVTVSVDERLEDVKPFLQRHGLTELPVLYDASRKIPESFGTTKYPESYLIDREGTVRYRFVNKRNWSSPIARACLDSQI